MSSFLRQLGSRLQTSSSARYVLYGAAAAGTTAITWRYHAQSRNEQLQRRNAARIAHAHSIVPPVKEDKQLDGIIVEAAPTPATADGDGEVEEEPGNTGAFDPVTGEINWDCPCLGGMAHGPCGPQFRLAFSCFVYSEAEPKGMDCVEKFKEMQDCFREHPDIYAEELADEGEEDDNDGPISSTTPPPETPPGSGGVGIEIPRPDAEPKPAEDDDLKLPGGAPPPKPPPKPPIGPPPLPPADPKPPTISDPPASPIPPPTIIDPPAAGPIRGGIATTRTRNPSRSQTPRE